MPEYVERKLKEIKNRTEDQTMLNIMKNKVNEGTVKIGQIFEDCSWYFEKANYPVVELFVDEGILRFPIKNDRRLKKYAKAGESIDVKFLGFGDNDRALFEYLPNVEIAKQVQDGFLYNIVASPDFWIEGENKMSFICEDESMLEIPLHSSCRKNSLFYNLLNSTKVSKVNLYICDGYASLDNKPYLKFQNIHKINDTVTISIIDEYEYTKEYGVIRTYYIVKCEDIYGVVVKRNRNMAKVGDTTKATIYMMKKDCIYFNI